MRILVIITGDYGQRHVDNLRVHAPDSWQIDVWQTPKALPPVLDYPEDYLPFCSLTETHSGTLRLREPYDDPLIAEFAQHFGRPAFEIAVDKPNGTITEVTATRDACCGCARFVAEKLAGEAVPDALEQGGLHHHHYPCQASMGIDPLFGDTLMHVSGNLMKDAIKEALGDNLRVQTIRPAGWVEDQNDPDR
jgi:hypothetical protein